MHKTIPRFFAEKSCLKLVFATLWQASQSWRGVRMSEFERQQLRLLRRQLGLLTEYQVEPFIEHTAIAA